MRRRLISAEAVSARTRKDPELVTECGYTTHGMCMQSGLDAAGVTDQPMSSTMRIQLDDDEGGIDRQAKHMVHEVSGRQRGNDYTDATRPAERPDGEHSWQPWKQLGKKETSFAQLLGQDVSR